MSEVRILHGDALEMLRTLDSESVQTCVTSPPYFGLRMYLKPDHPDYAKQIGLEPTFDCLGWARESRCGVCFICRLTAVFREVRRVLKRDGTLWLNIGDSYANPDKGGYQNERTKNDSMQASNLASDFVGSPNRQPQGWLKPKDMMLAPERLALSLQADGWYLRSRIIWHKRCLSGGAWLYARTQKGDMPAMLKDLVRLDPRTVQLWNGTNWTKVVGWSRSEDTSERVELVLRSGERIGCTGRHEWPTQRGLVAARDLRVGDVLKTCRLPDPAIKRPPYLTDDLLWLIGLYLAEGTRSGDARNLALHRDERDWLPRINHAAGAVGATVSCRSTKGNGIVVGMYGRVLAAVLDQYIGGRVAKDKHLTNAAWALDDAALTRIAQGYLDGDGHRDPKNDRWRLGLTRNYALERDLRTLAARLGATITLIPGNARYQGGTKPCFRGEWRWNRSGHHNEKDRGEVVEIRNSRARKFWDVEVEDDPHLFALASGVMTHNSAMPESVRDRPTKSHEHIWLLSKSERYFYDAAAAKEPVTQDERRPSFRGGAYCNNATFDNAEGGKSTDTGNVRVKVPSGWDTGPGAHGTIHRDGRTQEPEYRLLPKSADREDHGQRTAERFGHGAGWRENVRRSGNKARKPASACGVPVDDNGQTNGAVAGSVPWEGTMRNWRDVWPIGPEPYKGEHFATFPSEIPRRAIIAGSRAGDTVLDPFAGTGTTGRVAAELGRHAILIELAEHYEQHIRARTTGFTVGLPLGASA